MGRNRNRIYCPNGGTEWFVDDEYINEGSDENVGVLGVYDAALIWALSWQVRGLYARIHGVGT